MSQWDLSEEDADQLYEAVLVLARRLADRHGPPATGADATARQQADRRLAVLVALTHIRDEVEDAIYAAANRAGATGVITYADLGAAVGITRQSARTRWPDAIPAPRPGRPRTTELTLAQLGPHCHHEHTCSGRDGRCSHTGYVETWCRTPGCPLCGELLSMPYGAMAILAEQYPTLDAVRQPPTGLNGTGAPLTADEREQVLAYWDRYPFVRREGDPPRITPDRRQAGYDAVRRLAPKLWG
ncbi:hypothetical protein [Sphaerisporangium sp. NPDC051011]|uniref:hypothetical protein n=1 Tax=Sphaerisporangium sp. NPDC051011 TaxID=3155792 RepID=UPI0033F95990